jgi:sulfatase maturation enzyme AslB (radical SAM superfamily)
VRHAILLLFPRKQALMKEVLLAWRKMLGGHLPFLSVEITRECPLTCPGCYAYGTDHLGGALTLRDVRDLKGPALVEGVLALMRKHRPLHVSFVGGEPLVRYRELSELLPTLAKMGVRSQVVTSAVRPIPAEWRDIPHLNISVSIDGLQPEHDVRRKPATYERILQHIEGHQITVHCTVTRQQVNRAGYIEEFVQFWSAQPAAKRIWFSLYTPQIGEESPEMLTALDRRRVIEELHVLRARYSKLHMPEGLLAVYAEPPQSPDECIFARVTHCVSADLNKPITPCQFGGKPDCSSCGCVASAGMAAIARHRLPGGLSLGSIMNASLKIGKVVSGIRENLPGGAPPVPQGSPSTP